MKPVHLVLPIRVRTVNEMQYEHWGTKARYARAERRTTAMALKPRLPNKLPKKMSILITRAGPRMLDPDNSIASLKHVIDGVADALGIDDASPRLDWLYGQIVEPEYAVEITISKGGQS